MGVVDVRAADLLWSTLYALNMVAWCQDDDRSGELLDPNDRESDTFYAGDSHTDRPVTVYSLVRAALMLALTRLTGGDAHRAEQVWEALIASGEDVGYHLAWLKREQWNREDALIRSGRDGVLISDKLAREIAAEYVSSAAADESLTALATGAAGFDPHDAYSRLTVLMRGEFKGTDLLPELDALRDWVGERVPGIMVYTQEVPEDEWAAAVANGDAGPSVFPPTRTVEHVADAVGGEWFYPGDANYPADWEARGYERDDSDGSVFVPESVAVTVARMINGGHYATMCSAEPFAPGAWYETEEHSFTGVVTRKSIHLTGLTPEQEAEVYALWQKSMRRTA